MGHEHDSLMLLKMVTTTVTTETTISGVEAFTEIPNYGSCLVRVLTKTQERSSPKKEKTPEREKKKRQTLSKSNH